MSNGTPSAQAATAPLQVATMEEIKRDLGTAVPAAAPGTAEDRELDGKADQFVSALLAIDPKDFKARKDYTTAAESMGTMPSSRNGRLSTVTNDVAPPSASSPSLSRWTSRPSVCTSRSA